LMARVKSKFGTMEKYFSEGLGIDGPKFTNGRSTPTGEVKIEVETQYDSKERMAPATVTLTVNSIGEALMMAYWKDPAFDPKQRAFYYVRVLEIPTPRWTTYDAAFFGVELPKDVDPTHQERAYTSPIWYTPEK
ncbi:MAG: DUF3604 domain-containing protein, partial [Desulfobacterales bacterium]